MRNYDAISLVIIRLSSSFREFFCVQFKYVRQNEVIFVQNQLLQPSIENII